MEWTEANVLAALSDGNTVLDVVRSKANAQCMLNAKKTVNRILYQLEKQGKVRKHQPDPNAKPTWFHTVALNKAKEELENVKKELAAYKQVAKSRKLDDAAYINLD